MVAWDEPEHYASPAKRSDMPDPATQRFNSRNAFATRSRESVRDLLFGAGARPINNEVGVDQSMERLKDLVERCSRARGQVRERIVRIKAIRRRADRHHTTRQGRA